MWLVIKEYEDTLNKMFNNVFQYIKTDPDNLTFMYMKNIMQLPSKSMVIEFYEVRLTQFLKNLGFNCEPIYELKEKDGVNIVYKFPRELVEVGFPYVKTRLVRDNQDQGIAEEFLPQHLPIDQ